MRYLASLNVNGGVEVWKIKGQHETFEWDLTFTSVSDLANNPLKENQFMITLNSKEAQSALPDSILLFQYSRP